MSSYGIWSINFHDVTNKTINDMLKNMMNGLERE